ncbi:Arc family DNA-binding protein [Lysobacter firmicutimachus]|uniref:Arc family DNA-binding protein n=1 Tax=Lysobacter firmicutimachus TaxID=1792846 RepID=A0AAU8MYY0_9GAMM
MARTDPQINLRIPAGLKEAVEAAARASGRSTNAEIVYRLEESLTEQPKGVSPRPRSIVELFAEQFEVVGVHQDEEEGLWYQLDRLEKELGGRPRSREEASKLANARRLHTQAANALEVEWRQLSAILERLTAEIGTQEKPVTASKRVRKIGS